MAFLHRDGTVTLDRSNIVGKWWREYDGRVDRGVKLGLWVGETNSGERMTSSQRSVLSKWFDRKAAHDTKERGS